MIPDLVHGPLIGFQCFFRKWKSWYRVATEEIENQKPLKACSYKWLILLVHQEGFEPPTPGFEVRCSIQLSYWCMFKEPLWLSPL